MFETIYIFNMKSVPLILTASCVSYQSIKPLKKKSTVNDAIKIVEIAWQRPLLCFF